LTKRPRRPRDLNQLAASIVQQATGSGPNTTLDHEKNPAAVALGRLGGLKGGRVRAAKLTAERRREIARNAAGQRWAARIFEHEAG
jgi:hypothetical protein